MTENKLNPFEDDKEEHDNSVNGDTVDRELASEQQEQIVKKTNPDVSDHAHVL